MDLGPADTGILTGLVTSAPPAPSAERDALAATVREILQRYPAPAPGAGSPPGGYDQGLWSRLCDLGLTGLGLPEDLGGIGGTYLDRHAVLAELGRDVTASPLTASTIAAEAVLLARRDGAPAPLPEALLAPEGTATLTTELTAVPDGTGGWHLHGEAAVLDGARAAVILAAAPAAPAGAGWVLLETSPHRLRREVLPTLDQALHLARVTADGAPTRLVGTLPPHAPDLLAALRSIVVSAGQAGAAQGCLDHLVAYLRQRVQFGRPIGSFQAVKHRLADLLVAVQTATTASWAAAGAWAAGAPDAALLGRIAGSHCSEAYWAVAAESVQLHGGIAITWEHAAHRYLKHAHSTAALAGTPAEHRAALVARLRTATA